MKLLHINCSTRGSESQSLNMAKYLISEIKSNSDADIEVETLDLFETDLPPFAGDAVGAKMALFTGADASSEQKQAWEEIQKIFENFASADVYVFNVPLWNNGIPYILKQYIDIVTQPGWAFGFDPEKGYSGLLTSKKAFLVHASGVYYEGIPAGFGSDFSTPYLEDWLKFIGVEDVEHVHVAPTVVNPDFDKTKSEAETLAADKAKVLATA